MSEHQLHNFRDKLDRKYRSHLLARGIMPAAVVCIAVRGTNDFYSIHNGNRFSGFPVIDLAMVRDDGTALTRVQTRLDMNHGLSVPLSDIKLLPLASKPSPYIPNINNPGYERIHHRMYFPVVGVTDAIARPDARHELRPLDYREVENNVVAPRGAGVLEQLSTIHHELVSRYACVEPVPVEQ